MGKLPPAEERYRATEYFRKTSLIELNETFDAISTRRLLEQSKGAPGSMMTPRGAATMHGIDAPTFAQYFAYPGVLKDQIFTVFDTNKDGTCAQTPPTPTPRVLAPTPTHRLAVPA